MARQPSQKPAPLSRSRYGALLRDVRKLLVTAEEVANEQKVLAYWQLGQRIATERIAQGAGYHNSVLRDLAADSRIAIRTLQRAVLFHSAYSKPPASQHLTWSHYFILATVASADDRARLQKLAVDHGLSARQLAAAVQVGWTDDGSSQGTSSLPRPTEPSYLYGASVHSIVDGDTLLLDIDLGFHTSHQQRIRLAGIDAPERDTPEGREAAHFVAECLLPARTVVVQTRRADIYGRYVGHLFYNHAEFSIDECFANGRYLNAELVDAGHARLFA